MRKSHVLLVTLASLFAAGCHHFQSTPPISHVIRGHAAVVGCVPAQTAPGTGSLKVDFRSPLDASHETVYYTGDEWEKVGDPALELKTGCYNVQFAAVKTGDLPPKTLPNVHVREGKQTKVQITYSWRRR